MKSKEREMFLRLICEIRESQRTNLDDKVTLYVEELWYDYGWTGGDMGYNTSNIEWFADEKELRQTLPEQGEMLQIYQIDCTYLELITHYLEDDMWGLFDKRWDKDTVEPDYASVEDAVIVTWAWEKYVGYCRRFHSVRYGYYKETEKDLITGNEECTFRYNMSVLVSKEDLEGLTDEQKLDLIQEELGRDSWKWSYFHHVANRQEIADYLNLENLTEDEN